MFVLITGSYLYYKLYIIICVSLLCRCCAPPRRLELRAALRWPKVKAGGGLSQKYRDSCGPLWRVVSVMYQVLVKGWVVYPLSNVLNLIQL
eukprot:SAG31_NODE_1841_length_7117_cov_12.976207_6_plen_91_part_00